MTQVNKMTDRIQKRRHNERADDMEFQASLKGMKVNIPRVGLEKEPAKEPLLTEEAKIKAGQVSGAAIARKMREKQGGYQ